jgi:hypothetical protein
MGSHRENTFYVVRPTGSCPMEYSVLGAAIYKVPSGHADINTRISRSRKPVQECSKGESAPGWEAKPLVCPRVTLSVV